MVIQHCKLELNSHKIELIHPLTRELVSVSLDDKRHKSTIEQIEAQ